MNKIEGQPTVSVGLMTGLESVSFQLKSDFISPDGALFKPGDYSASQPLHLIPVSATSSFVIRDVVIGIGFHWERKQDQEFQGALRIIIPTGADRPGHLTVINEVPVESYLLSVISSEMSPSAHADLLRAHSIISRSWLLAQTRQWKRPRCRSPGVIETTDGADEGAQQLIRWYDQESHTDFDVCADDHCQRYQGGAKATSANVFDAIKETFGLVLSFGGELCDARFSKSCGGMTERFSAAWDEVDAPYLQVSYDGQSFPPEFDLPLSVEANAQSWIRHAPPAFCNTSDPGLLSKILPDFDQETADFYRWRVDLEQNELQELLRRKLGVEFGRVLSLDPVERGGSGRIIKLKITGERESVIIGKELEIRRALSPSHLYSSAFVVESGAVQNGAPISFTLTGAGWGHGVGLCQIGAALMAELGYDYKQILSHYYRGAQLATLYTK